MRELAKAFNSLAWAMTLYPIQQLTNLAKKEDDSDRTERMTESFSQVTSATEAQFSGVAKSLYEAGNTFQQEVIDSTFAVVSPRESESSSVADATSTVFEAFKDLVKAVIPGDSSDDEEGEEAPS